MQHGGGDGADGLFGAAAGAQAVELGLEIAALLAGRRPGALDQRGLQPGRALAHAVGAALAGALVVRGHSPAQEIRWPRVGKRLMSMADLGEDHVGRRGRRSPGWSSIWAMAARKGSTIARRPPDRSAAMASSRASICWRCRASRKRWWLVTRPRSASRRVSGAALIRRCAKLGQAGGIGLAGDQRLDHRPAADAQ